MTRMDDIVSALTEAIGPLLDKPCAFFGQSMGGLIAFELTRALRRQGLQTPFHLFVSATRAPQTERQIGQLDELSDADFMSEVQQRYGGVPPEVTDHQELLDIVLPTLRADFRVMHNYCYVEEPPLDIPVSVFGGLKDSEVTEDSLRAWRDATRGDCKVRLYPGGHFVSSENERAVINSIQADLAMSGAGTT